jgi:hypothetical protein
MSSNGLPSSRRIDGVVSTLGPSGTDSAHEAERYFSKVLLFPSFAEAIEHSERTDGYALVPTGYIQFHEGELGDSWVNMHFRLLGRMRIVDVWASPTKPMCLAINRQRVSDRESIRSIALHPATAAIARQLCGEAAFTFLNSKPMAVEAAAKGQVDACIGSIDVVSDYPLEPIDFFHPTMVWTLYGREPSLIFSGVGSDDTLREQANRPIKC